MKRIFLIGGLCFFLLPGIAKLQEKPSTGGEPVKTETKSEKSWADKIKFKGDLRYRHEMIDEEEKDTRTRHRIRARLSMEASVNDDTDVVVRLASGEGTDPVSTNQTIGGSFTKKAEWLDQAYFNWHPDNFSLMGGKMKNPFQMPGGSDLIWDGDLNPEGLSIGYSMKPNPVGLFLNAGYFWVEERKADDDSMLYGIQGGVNFKIGDNSSLIIGAGYFSYDNIKGFPTFYDTTKGFGNTTAKQYDDEGNETGDVLYAHEYDLIEAMIEFGTKIASVPVKVYGDFVQNGDPDDDNTGMLFGVTIGKLKDPFSFEFSYNYRDLEKDAVVGAFCDSDFIGGGTDGKGHKFGMGLQLAKNCSAGFTYFMNDKKLSDPVSYDRMQIDLALKF